ncbi:MAG: primosomal protein N', partial [Alphaproteobacteria bacterium]
MLLPLPLADAYDYRANEEVSPPGSFVAVPLGGRQVIGVVWDEAPESQLPEHRLRPIAAVLEAPPMPEKLRRFVDWVAAYTLSPRGAVLRMAMSVPAALEALPHRAGWCRADPLPEAARLTPARQRVLAALPAHEVRAPEELARDAGVAPAVRRGMADAGLRVPGLLPPLEGFRPPERT